MPIFIYIYHNHIGAFSLACSSVEGAGAPGLLPPPAGTTHRQALHPQTLVAANVRPSHSVARGSFGLLTLLPGISCIHAPSGVRTAQGPRSSSGSGTCSLCTCQARESPSSRELNGCMASRGSRLFAGLNGSCHGRVVVG